MSSQNIRSWLCGPMVAVATPFKEDLSLDLDVLTKNIRFMIDRGVKTGDGTLLVGGAGGEHPAMNVEERMAVMKTAQEAANGETPVLTSIQHTDTRVIVKLAQYASEIGLHGVQLGPTYYYQPSEDDVVRLFEQIDAESDVNLMIYHTWWEGLTMSLPLIDQLSEIGSVNALKWSAPNSQLYRDGLTTFSDRLAIIDNGGEHIWSNILGASGFITHLSGFWPEYPLEIWNLLQQSEYGAAKDRLSEFKW
ncbi:MAG: dihydrodipicolinate synthase family protein, partial [Chloroflexota bacterium]|nr:dihydrodipicolinate synthase family protein [Chloroflexota bacterium]